MKLCLSIGISQTEGHTDLPGAILAANEMGQWARGSGYSTIVITDEGGEVVTIDLIRKWTSPALLDDSQVPICNFLIQNILIL